MIQKIFLLVGVCVTVICCAASPGGERSAYIIRSGIRLCLESQVTLENPLIERDTLQISDQIRRVSITENAVISLRTILFTVKSPYPGSPVFFCNIDIKTGRMVNALFEVGEHRDVSVVFDARDRYEGYSDDQIEVIVNRSSTIMGIIEDGVTIFEK